MSSLTKYSIIFTCIGIVTHLLNHYQKTNRIESSFDLRSYSKNSSNNFPFSVNCENSKTGYLEFHGSVIAEKSFSEFNELEADPRRLALYQLKYVDGLLDHQSHERIRFVPYFEKQVEVLTVKKIKYPIDIHLDEIPHDSTLYPRNIMGSTITKGSEALEVTYKARVKVTACSNSKKVLKEKVEIILPLDPYLAYWYIPKDKRVEMTYHPKVKMITTPCSSKVMAQLRLPSMYWNTWKPSAKDCTLEHGKHIAQFKAEFIPIDIQKKTVQFNHLKMKNKIKISLVNGLLSPEDTEINLSRARSLLPLINEPEKIAKEKFKGQDVAVMATFSLHQTMKRLSVDTKWTYKDFKDHIVFNVSGKLLHSHKKFELEIYLGPSVNYQTGRLHWDFLASALRKSDFIFYSGHAGLGSTFSLNELNNAVGFVNFKDSPENQFIGVLSCSSASYFGDDFIRERMKLSKTTDFLLTGFDDHAYEIVPAVIQYIDLELSGNDYSLKSILESHLPKNHDIHLTRN